MMRWPWSKNERRQSGGAYTDAIVSLIQQAATGGSAGEPGALAALEIAAGWWARGLASAELDPPIAAVTPSVLASIGRELVRRGESLWAVDVRRGQLTITPAGSWDVAGGADPASWFYRLDLFGPSGNETRVYPSAAVLHFRYASDPERPWQGISPLGYARLSGKLAANLELRLGEEAGSRVGHLLAIPADGGDSSASDPLAMLKSDLGALAGSVALVETVAGAWGEGKAAAPLSDWKPQRLGANPPATLAELRGAAAEDVLSACAVPAPLASATSEGTSQREAWRRFSVGTIQPAARLVAEELSNKLDVPGLRLHFEALGAADLAGRARAVGVFKKSGVPLPRALELAGLRG